MTRRPLRFLRASLLSLLGTAILACGGGEATAPGGSPTITITPTSGATIVAGQSVLLTAALANARGKPVANATFTWSSSNPAVASVSPSGAVTASGTGTATITASSQSAGASASATWIANVVAGPPAKLVVTVQPAGSVVGRPLTTQPVVEVRDQFDNLVTNVVTSVLASPLSGPPLGGTTSVSTVGGVARFTDLVITGSSGGRTLQFTSGSITAVNSQSFTVAAGPPAAVAFAVTLPVFRSGVPATVVAKLQDASGNDALGAGRTLRLSVSGTGVTLTNGTAQTDSTGRATFSGVTLTGQSGTRTLAVAADSITAPASSPISLIGGRPFRLAIERDAPATGEFGAPLSPPPQVRLLDSLGNSSAESGVAITASVVEGAPVTNATATTDASGVATFTALTIGGSALATRTLQFTAPGLPAITARRVTLAPPDTSPVPAVVSASASGDTLQKIITLSTPTGSAALAVVARDAVQRPVTTAGVRWFARDPSRVRVDSTTGAVTGLQPGRTFVIAQARRNALVADSVLVFVPRNANGPIVRTTLSTYRIATDTFSVVVQIDPRDARGLSGADFEVAWPGSLSSPFSPFNVTNTIALAPGVTFTQLEGRQNVRVTWTSATPVTGPVTLLRLVCVVNQRLVGNQVLITVNQLLAGDLTDLTALASVFNPFVIIP